jgi:hypothetical protein
MRNTGDEGGGLRKERAPEIWEGSAAHALLCCRCKLPTRTRVLDTAVRANASGTAGSKTLPAVPTGPTRPGGFACPPALARGIRTAARTLPGRQLGT